MDIRRFILPLHKWWWLLVLATLIAGGASYFATRGQPPVYQARTTLMIGSTISDPNPSSSEFFLGEQLAGAYADIANRELVRNATLEKLGLRRLPEYIARAVPKTQLIEIIVTDQNPERAQLVANELAAQLILFSPTSVEPDEQDRLEFVNRQLGILETQIEETQDEIDTLREELGDLVSAQEIADTQNRIAALQTKLNTLQNTYASLLASTNQEATNTLTIIEPAALPRSPIGPSKNVTVLLSAGVGLVLAISAAYLLEYVFDNSLKFPEEVEQIFQAPIIGHVFVKRSWRKSPPPLISGQPDHPNTEDFQSLKTNLRFSEREGPLKTILVASPEKQGDTSLVAANLAISMEDSCNSVILVDANLRHPRLHEYFQLPNEKGLSEVISERIPLEESLQVIGDSKLAIISSGSLLLSPIELLTSERMYDLLGQLAARADVVIINSPSFVRAEAPILASRVDGVLAVVQPDRTGKSEAQNMVEQIERAGARLVGVLLNRIPVWGAAYYAKVSPN